VALTVLLHVLQGGEPGGEEGRKGRGGGVERGRGGEGERGKGDTAMESDL